MKSLPLGQNLEIIFLSNVPRIRIAEFKRMLKFGNVQYVIVILLLGEFYKNIEKMSITSKSKVFMGIIQKLMLFVNSAVKFVLVSVI